MHGPICGWAPMTYGYLWVAPDPLKFIDGPFHLWMALSKEHHRASMELPHHLWMAPTQLMGGPRRIYGWPLHQKF